MGLGGRALCKVDASAVFLRCGGLGITAFDLLPQLNDLSGRCFGGDWLSGAATDPAVTGRKWAN